jgi:hypothetical protein
MLASTLVAVALATRLALAPPADASHRSQPDAPQDGPEFGAGAIACVLQLARAYSDRDLAAYARTLASDFRYTFGDPELRAAYPQGFARADEIASADHLFHGFTDRSGQDRAPARSIAVQLDSLYVVPDLAHPDSTGAYACVVVSRTSLEIVLTNGEVFRIGPDVHAYHCVRGDAALLEHDQRASADCWYVRAWDELPAGVAPPPAPPARPVAAPARVADPPPALAIRPLANPLRGPAFVQLALPAATAVTLDVLDVLGRRLEQWPLGALEAGVHRLPFATGDLAPGVYWLRVTQGHTAAASRVVVIR